MTAWWTKDGRERCQCGYSHIHDPDHYCHKGYYRYGEYCMEFARYEILVWIAGHGNPLQLPLGTIELDPMHPEPTIEKIKTLLAFR